MMVQMWLADSQLSGGHCDVVRSICAAFGAPFEHQQGISRPWEVLKSLQQAIYNATMVLFGALF